MKTKLTIAGLMTALLLSAATAGSLAHGDGFNDAVKIIEQFYHVKHQSIPLLARAGMKAVRTAARIRGGDYKRLADAGSVRVAFFEDQNFDSRGQIASFKQSMQATLAGNWPPLLQKLPPKNEEKNYIFIRDPPGKVHSLGVTTQRAEAT